MIEGDIFQILGNLGFRTLIRKNRTTDLISGYTDCLSFQLGIDAITDDTNPIYVDNVIALK